MIRIEEAYQTLAEGTMDVYDWVHANEEIAEAWVRSELADAANAYQTLVQNVGRPSWNAPAKITSGKYARPPSSPA